MKQSGKEVVERDTASKREAEGKEISEGEKQGRGEIHNKHRRTKKKRDETEQIGCEF